MKPDTVFAHVESEHAFGNNSVLTTVRIGNISRCGDESASNGGRDDGKRTGMVGLGATMDDEV